MMRDYIAVRREGERLIRESGIPATILRPWYVLGPGHRWPYALLPLYALLARLPSAREGARRLGLVTQEQMLRALVRAIEEPAAGTRVIGVPEIGKLPRDGGDVERGGQARSPATPVSCRKRVLRPRRD